MNVKKDAARDAGEFARAQMFYGEGAGTRRKLITASVNYKMDHVPGYRKAFEKAYSSQDMAKHAKHASKERLMKDTSKKLRRNSRAIVSGNRQNLTAGVGIAILVGTWAHETGNDKKALEYTKKKYRQIKNRVEVRQFKQKIDNVVHNIKDL